MNAKTPLFSIVIPTRNRAHVLPYALRSALNQTFDDYEIVVVANDCQDNTKEIVEKFATSRVKYFESPKMLTMPENWQFAWSKAQGKYITYLCDDDALTPFALSLIAEKCLHENPEIISWEDAIYYYPSWEKGLQNTLLLFNFGDILVEETPTDKLHQELSQFKFKWSSPIPKMLNCVARRDFFEKWNQSLGKLFFPIAPDYSFAWLATQICSKIRVLHYPLSVRGISDVSIGSNAGMGEAGMTFLKEFGEFDFFVDLNLDLPLTINHLAATFLRVNCALEKANFATKSFDRDALVIALANQLIDCRDYLSNWEILASKLISESQRSSKLSNEINLILSSKIPTQKEEIRDLHKRTRNMALEYLPNISHALQKHGGDLKLALSSLALMDEVLIETNWSYLYLFGETINSYDIYTISTFVEQYYKFLLRGKVVVEA